MLDLVSFAAAMKTKYPNWKVENLVFSDNPFMAMVPKMETFFGDSMKYALIYGDPQARSASFATANGLTSNSKLNPFFLTRTKDYSIATIDNETIEASNNDSGAILRAASVEMDGAINALSRSRAIQCYRSGSGSIARLSASSGTTTTLTLADPSMGYNIEVGQFLESGPNDSSTGLNTTTGTQGLVTGINRDTGVVTLQTAIPSLAASDYLFARGDASRALFGLDAWLPYDNRAARLAATFCGTTRTADTQRQGGLIHDGTSQPIEEALIDSAKKLGRVGAKPSHVFMNFEDWGDLVKALGSKVVYCNVKVGEQAQIGFEGILINGPTGPIKVFGDINTPKSDYYMLQLNTWELCSLGKLVKVFTTDGLQMLRAGSDDALQVRINSYAQLGCKAPGFNLHGRLAS